MELGGLKKLQSLEVCEWCNGFSATGLEKLANLRELKDCHSNEFDGTGLGKLINLLSLEVRWCKKFKREELEKLINLRKLKVINCPANYNNIIFGFEPDETSWKKWVQENRCLLKE